MAFSWAESIISETTQIKRTHLQEIIDDINYMEDTKLKFGCIANTMYPSGRTQGSDTASKFSGWKSDMSPTFNRINVEKTDVTTIRDAIDPIFDDKDTCRVVYAADYQSNLGAECGSEQTSDDSSENDSADASQDNSADASQDNSVDVSQETGVDASQDIGYDSVYNDSVNGGHNGSN